MSEFLASMNSSLAVYSQPGLHGEDRPGSRIQRRYALVVLWDKHFKQKVNNDSPKDIQWLYEQAKERADTFGPPTDGTSKRVHSSSIWVET